MTNVRNHSYLMVKIIPFILDPYRSPQSSTSLPFTLRCCLLAAFSYVLVAGY